jgi:hypothetical protein
VIRLDDLPPGRLRDAALAALAESPATSAPVRTSTAARARARPPRGRYRCNTCGALESAYAPAQRHADAHGGARIEIMLEGRT